MNVRIKTRVSESEYTHLNFKNERYFTHFSAYLILEIRWADFHYFFR